MDPGSLVIIWPYLLALGLLAALAWSSWRKGSVPGALSLTFACLFQALWLVGAVGELLAADIAVKIAWFKFQAIWKLPTVTATTCFALEYVNPGRWLTRRTLILLSIPPILSLLLVLTNDLTHWYWTGFLVDGSVQPARGPANWILNVYGMALVLVNITAFVWLFIRSPQHRWPAALIVAGQIAGRVLYAVDLATGHAGIQPSPVLFGLLITIGTYAAALFAFRILDPLPAARRIAIEQMRDGMLVFDTRWQALSLNPAAERILGVAAAQARGKTLSELLPSCPDAGGWVEREPNPCEINLRMGDEARYYALALSGLHDHRGLAIGHLLLMRDVTEQHQAQTQLLKQQWSEAALQERELLAQELHDGLAQSLGFLNLQAQAARLYLQAGQAKSAQENLERLTEVALEMQGDTRELIGDLLTVSLPSEGLCAVVRRAVARFEEQTGLPVSLELTENLDAVCNSEALPPAAGVQLLRILQEALANVRKHAGSPSQIGVRLAAEAAQVEMTIVDNGAGFDPALAGAGGKHFGLQVMGQRAERLGGHLVVYSAPGQGTRVGVCVPLDGNTGGQHENPAGR